MKVICFGCPYSNYFSDLVFDIESKLGFKMVKEYFPYNQGEKLYLKGFESASVELNSNNVHPSSIRVLDIKNLSTASIDLQDARNREIVLSLKVLYSSIYQYIIGNRNAMFFIYNDLRCANSYAIDILNKLGIKYFVFERGVFRPHTTTMDFRGVNATSNFRTMPVPKQLDNPISNYESTFFVDREFRNPDYKFIVYFVYNKLISAFDNMHIKSIKRITPSKSTYSYVKLFIKKILSKTNESNNTITKPFIFVPLQLSNDTQTLINSPYLSTQDFINSVTNSYKNSIFFNSYDLVFKVHPLDVELYSFDDCVKSSIASTESLVEDCEFCVTINSTVGFEALFMKKVICLGDSFYTDHGMVYRALEKENYFNNIFDFEQSLEPHIYRAWVLYQYQVPGSIYNYNKNDISFTSDKVISYFF